MDKAIGWRVNVIFLSEKHTMRSADCLLESEWCFSPLGRTWCAKNEKRPTACPGAPLVEKCSRWQVARANQSASEYRTSVYWTYTTKRLQIIRRVIIKLLRMSKTTHWLVSVKSVTKQNEKKKDACVLFSRFSLIFLDYVLIESIMQIVSVTRRMT